MNWGHGIMIFILLFICLVLGAVFFAMQQTNEMFDADYYQKELEYQSVIDARQNLSRISDHKIVHQNLDEVIIIFPVGTFEKLERGTIELLRADDQQRDVILEVIPTGYDRRIITKSTLSKGVYRTRIHWTSGGTPFYAEETLYVE